jgi:hypothetical protein
MAIELLSGAMLQLSKKPDHGSSCAAQLSAMGGDKHRNPNPKLDWERAHACVFLRPRDKHRSSGKPRHSQAPGQQCAPSRALEGRPFGARSVVVHLR